MGNSLQKLQPDRDLQCYFLEPSAIAALSGASPTGFTISGTWRQQFDWAVLEWNRDNVFEHPYFRNLPDGDLSGITLTYQESRQNCIPLDSSIYPTVDWPSLRLWADTGNGDQIYWIPLASYATPVEGAVVPATITLTLQGSATGGDYVGFAFLNEHYTYQFYGTDTLESAVAPLVTAVNDQSPTMHAAAVGDTAIQLSYLGASKQAGANGNVVSVYTYVSGAGTESWDKGSGLLQGGQSPATWQISLNFGALKDQNGNTVPTSSVRKLRWTWAADMQPGAFSRSEFQVSVTNWSVTGNDSGYVVNGPPGFRIEDNDPRMTYTGAWSVGKGNFSGGTINSTAAAGASVACSYEIGQVHDLYVGTRLAEGLGTISVSIDGGAAQTIILALAGEDVLVRKQVAASLPAGTHTFQLQNVTDGATVYFDFLEIVTATSELPQMQNERVLALATDWDTNNSIAIAPERTAWQIQSLGFHGRVNHYAGALWFFELVNSGNAYATGSLTFQGTPAPNETTVISIGIGDTPTTISHLNFIGDTAETIATAFAQVLNQGSTAVWSTANGNQLVLQARALGAGGNSIAISGTGGDGFQVIASGPSLNGGTEGTWLTDLTAEPRLNRAARDWSSAFFTAIKSYGLDCVASFSTELQFGDPSVAAGIAQRYPSGAAVTVNTPALQTNFSPASRAFWQDVYLQMAGLQAAAGLIPYVQFGEIQWWYFADDGSGLPFYDQYTTSTFQQQYGRPLAVITDRNTDPSTVSEDVSFLQGLIAAHTSAIAQYVRASYPSTRFEVLYPTDTNNTALMQAVNFAGSCWTPQNLNCLKTEAFTFTYARNLDLALASMQFCAAQGFPPAQSSHLTGIGDSSTAWGKECRMAQALGFESVVLFALDQLCLIGYSLPVSPGLRRSLMAG